jgi:hypothetical protein
VPRWGLPSPREDRAFRTVLAIGDWHTARYIAAMRVGLVLVLPTILLGGCNPTLARMRSDAGTASDARAATDVLVLSGTDAGPPASAPDAPPPPPPPPMVDAGPPPPPPPTLPPPAAVPPSGPPDHSYVVSQLATERPDLLAASCVAMGGTNDFFFEVVRRLRAIDVRYGITMRGGAMLPDRVAYFWADGAMEGRSEIYAIDIILRHCARPGIDPPAAPGWGDDTAGGGTWTILPLTGGPPPPPVDPPPGIRPLPDASGVVRDLAAERPDLLAASCVADGGNNEFLFELVRRLRRMDPRWGLNWKRAVIGDMSQDVVDYFHGAGDPVDGSFDTYVVDVIGGHCGPTPGPAWIDVTVLGSTGARWTLAGRTDLGP